MFLIILRINVEDLTLTFLENQTIVSGLFSIIEDMLYPVTSLRNDCSNTSVEIVNKPSNHVSWYPPCLFCNVVLQSWQGMRIVLINPLFQISQRKKSRGLRSG